MTAYVRTFWRHEDPWCDPQEYLVLSSSEYAECAVCGSMEETRAGMMPFTALVQEEYVEPCDCGDRIQHRNGGHYHMSRFRVLQLID
ncbi:MAG: hypothetical protein KatS3mg082_3377 [Nitrospiraceae bacterium]|nr:MAG: hypothetical protein KatS3mg051_1842 [Anaerolineae bacterium]GIW56973.1 MAG: hypothetical protein KatS3mg082_3377 [Nitrospiraceae bacterium]